MAAAAPGAAPAEDGVEVEREGLGGERLADEEERAGGQCLAAHERRALGGDEAEGRLVARGAQRLEELQARHLGHVPVGEDEVGAVRGDGLEPGAAGVGLDDLVAAVAGLAQGADDDLAHDAGVVDDEDSHRGPSWGVMSTRSRPAVAW